MFDAGHLMASYDKQLLLFPDASIFLLNHFLTAQSHCDVTQIYVAFRQRCMERRGLDYVSHSQYPCSDQA